MNRGGLKKYLNLAISNFKSRERFEKAGGMRKGQIAKSIS